MIHIYYKAPKSSTPSPRRPGEGGFTLLEMLVVISVVGIMMAISLPIINTTLINMHVASAASSLSGAVQTARYQAISTGCPVQFTTIPASNSYQLATEVVTGSPPACASTYTNVGNPVPFASSDVLVPSVTFLLNPGGTVTSTSVVTAPASFSMQVTNGSTSKTVTVNGVGNVTITTP
jgi:prepilin-type N-terminal cleavage/methylation domain-containing protein